MSESSRLSVILILCVVASRFAGAQAVGEPVVTRRHVEQAIAVLRLAAQDATPSDARNMTLDAFLREKGFTEMVRENAAQESRSPGFHVKNADLDIDLLADEEYVAAMPKGWTSAAAGEVVFVGYGTGERPETWRIAPGSILMTPASESPGVGDTHTIDRKRLSKRIIELCRFSPAAVLVVWPKSESNDEWQDSSDRLAEVFDLREPGVTVPPLVGIPWDVGRILVSDSPGGNLQLLVNLAPKPEFKPVRLGVEARLEPQVAKADSTSKVYGYRLDGATLPADRPIVFQLRADVLSSPLPFPNGDVASRSDSPVEVLALAAAAADIAHDQRRPMVLILGADKEDLVYAGSWLNPALIVALDGGARGARSRVSTVIGNLGGPRVARWSPKVELSVETLDDIPPFVEPLARVGLPFVIWTPSAPGDPSNESLDARARDIDLIGRMLRSDATPTDAVER